MCSGIYQTSKDEIENTRLILQISYERCNQLVSVNNQSVGIVSAIIIGLISFLGSAYFTSTDPARFYAIILAIHIIIITVIFWRYYAHIIDDDITKSYKKILFCENKMNVSTDLSLRSSLEQSVKLNENPIYLNQNIETKIAIIQKLIDRNRIGYRYHDLLDFVAKGVFVTAFATLASFVITNNIPLPTEQYFCFLFFLPICYVIFLIGLEKDVFSGIPIQKDPTCEDFNVVFSEIGIFKKIKKI
jgi:hypothetical protein